MLIYIIRHGETELNKAGVLQGQTDVALNDSGRKLAAITGRELADVHFDACISSPLIRARETAEIVLRESGHGLMGDPVVPIETDRRIEEMCFGEFEGHKLTEMGEENCRLFMMDSFHFPGFPGGEDFNDLCERTQAFLKELVARDDGRTYLVATHGCALRAMLNYLYEDPSSFWQDNVPYNCCINIIEAEGGEARLIEKDKVYYPSEWIVDHYSK